MSEDQSYIGYAVIVGFIVFFCYCVPVGNLDSKQKKEKVMTYALVFLAGIIVGIVGGLWIASILIKEQ